jgi:hypothetical protein
VRLLLDAHVSGPRIGTALAASGHDVRALDQERALEGLADNSVLDLAAREERILVTFDVADFPGILRRWAEGGRQHAGVILVYGLLHHEYGAVVAGVEHWLGKLPRAEAWHGVAVVVDRSTGLGG